MQDGAFTVHVIDDDEAVRESLEALLIVAGYDVATYEAAEAFLGVSAGEGCVLLDIHMPGMGGIALLRDLRARRSRLPVLVLTASREPALEARVLELGAQAFLTKPVHESALIAALRVAEGAAV